MPESFHTCTFTVKRNASGKLYISSQISYFQNACLSVFLWTFWFTFWFVLFTAIMGRRQIASVTLRGILAAEVLRPPPKFIATFTQWSSNMLHRVTHVTFNPIQDRGGSTPRPTSFFPVTSANVGISPQNFLNFSFNLFDKLV